jgi:hypothetical protein
MDLADFRDRARREAERYGSDPWVFVRELLQNARDAGARRVEITALERDGRERVTCRDDGCGMSFEHARLYLFTLYASSKEKERGAAGRFGVGFWSLLRFEPDLILVRSWPGHGTPWEVELDGGLLRWKRRPPPRGGRGTEVVLERAAADGELARHVREAAFESARYLRRRDHPRRALPVRVNGEVVTARFELPPPSAGFQRGRLRGVVGLGPEARVELFAQGLRVRSASALEDLLSSGDSSGDTQARFPAIADGVAPQAILDGDGLEPLLARGDVRDDRTLRRLVGLARVELSRLLELQIDALRPRSLLRRAGWPLAAVGAVAALLGALRGVVELESRGGGAFEASAPAGGEGPETRKLARVFPAGDATSAASRPSRDGVVEASAALGALPPRPGAYRDLGRLYRGPSTDGPEDEKAGVALSYTPGDVTLFFAALVLDDPFAPATARVAGPYLGAPCRAGCVDVILSIEDGPGPLRLPLPTGQRLDAREVRLDGRPVPVFASPSHEPLLLLGRPTKGVVHYRTGPAIATSRKPRSDPALPSVLREEAERLQKLPPRHRVAEATAWVQSAIAYSTSQDVAARQRLAIAAGKGVLESALELRAGDCDVQSAALTLLLQASGTPARMAVGFVGRRGQARALLHAWVEAAGEDGRWRVADASHALSALASPRRAAAAPPSIDAVAPALPPEGGLRPWMRAVAPGLGAGLLLLGFWRARPRRQVRLDPSQDLARLIQGALQQPEAFRHAPALFHRRLLPCHCRRPASLGEAWDLAAAGRLYASTSGSPLARRAAARGGVVLDTRSAEARAVADALGARNLDEWQAFLSRARRTGLLASLDARMHDLGAAWEVREAAGVGAPAILDLPGQGRVVVLDEAEEWLVAAERRFASRPAEAVFDAVDHLADVLGLEGDERARILAPLAREAVREAGR